MAESPELELALSKLGARISERRKALNISQDELAWLSGFHRTFVGTIERGETNISMGSLFRVAAALGTYPWELLKGINLDPKSSPENSEQKAVKELVAKREKAPADRRRKTESAN